MYTTNIIESVNSKFRKATAGRRVFPTEESLLTLLKCLYMAAMELERKWTKIKDWPHIYSQIVILFDIIQAIIFSSIYIYVLIGLAPFQSRKLWFWLAFLDSLYFNRKKLLNA